MTKVLIGADHAGFERKQKIIETHSEIEWVDLGTNSLDSVDYPDFSDLMAKRLSVALESDPEAKGILICGSGQGVAIRANRHSFIRASVCWNAESAKLAREHNNANVLCFGARLIDLKTSLEMVNVFLATGFLGGRHEARVAKLSRPPQSN